MDKRGSQASNRVYFRLFILGQVAIEGIKVGSKPSIAIPEIVLTEAIEIVKTSSVAEKILREFPACRP